MKRTLIYLLAAVAGPATLVSAQDDAALAQAKANEQRLRDTLRATTQQLRAAEGEKATLQAQQAEDAQKIADLEARAARLTQELNDEKAAADKSRADLQALVLKGKEEVARLNASLTKWKAAYDQTAGVAKKAEAERSRLSATNIELERRVEARERQNLELYQTGAEILQRYADFSLGRALAAREPFTGLARARLEEQIQDYADKLEDNKLKPAPGDGKPATQPAAQDGGKARSSKKSFTKNTSKTTKS